MKLIKLLLLLSVFTIPANSYAGNALITDITTDKNTGALTVTAELRGGLNKNIIETIQSGISVILKYSIELRAKRGLWFDKKILSKSIMKIVKYNTLTKEYFLTSLDGDSNSNEVIKKFDDVIEWMTNLKKIPLVSSKPLLPGRDHYVRIKAEMTTKKLWFPLNYLLFFIPTKDINTGWVMSDSIK